MAEGYYQIKISIPLSFLLTGELPFDFHSNQAGLLNSHQCLFKEHLIRKTKLALIILMIIAVNCAQLILSLYKSVILTARSSAW